jgi:hypothetical protein
MPTAEEIAAAAAAESKTPAAEPAAQTFSQADVARLLADAKRDAREKGASAGRAELIAGLKDLGVTDEETLKTLLKTGDEARRAQLTAAEKATEAAKKAEEKATAAEARAAAADARAAKAEAIAEARPKDRELVEALYDKAATSKDFDPKAWLEEQRTKRPALFEGTAAGEQPGAKVAPTTLPTIPGGAPAARGNGAAPAYNAATATPEETAAYERSLGIAPAR